MVCLVILLPVLKLCKLGLQLYGLNTYIGERGEMTPFPGAHALLP